MEKFLNEINRIPPHYGDYVKKVRDLFSEKEKRISREESTFFTQYWQVFSWAAILGFIHNKRINGADLKHKQSIPFFRTIMNNGEDIGQTLILLGISKTDTEDLDIILNPRKILTIIGEYAEGGAKYVLDYRNENPGFFDYSEHFLQEINGRSQED